MYCFNDAGTIKAVQIPRSECSYGSINELVYLIIYASIKHLYTHIIALARGCASVNVWYKNQ